MVYGVAALLRQEIPPYRLPTLKSGTRVITRMAPATACRDGDRMYLQLDKSGAKYWRMNYRFAGKDKTLALGVYPDVSLAAARKKREQVREKHWLRGLILARPT